MVLPLRPGPVSPEGYPLTMNVPRSSVLLTLVFGLAAVFAAERTPIEDFAREPSTGRARLAPDGKRLSFLRQIGARTVFHIADLGSGKISTLELGDAPLLNEKGKEVATYTWVGNERLIITTAVADTLYGVLAVDWNGNNGRPISGYEDNKVSVNGKKFFAREIIHRFFDKDNTVLMLDRHDGVGNPNRPDILRVNTATGLHRTVLKNPGEVARYGLDNDGVARLGILSHGELSGAIYRTDEKAEWQTILPLQRRTGQLHPLGLDGTRNRIFVSDLNAKRRWAVFAMDPLNGNLGDPLVSDDEYDIIPERFAPSMDGISLAGPIFSDARQSLIGIRYYTESPRVKWLDADYAKYQLAVDKALPNTVNLMVDQSRDGKRLLWFAFSDQDPGGYYLLDLEAKSFKPLGSRMPWIKPAQMAPMLAVKYAARDGLTIHGYLTVPPGHDPKNLPLVVLPHGGPWVRDMWGFNPLVQLIASRGYAVLQMNYRGSTGYGDELYQQARREIGGKIQDDIEDATRWALTVGLADPQRIAIVGGSYGGYSALYALGRNPELYRCGISLAGVTDWVAIYEDSDVAENKAAKKYWREQIGDPDKDMERLKSISPVNFADQITAPVLIIQGKKDQRVPQDQARRMIEALEKAGNKPATLFLNRAGHNLGNESERTDAYRQVVDFLEQHLGPGVE